MPIHSYVALGDSFTEGLHDDLRPDGRHLGWADRLAAALAIEGGGLRYANAAVRGRLLGAVAGEQVPLAEALRPDLVSFSAGANDILRPKVDIPRLLDDYQAAVTRLRATGAQVLLFTVIGRAGGSGRTADALAGRFGLFNERVRAAAAATGALVADLGAVPALGDRRLWHEDRLHLAPEGHRRVTAAALEALGVTDPALLDGEPGWWRLPLGEAPPSRRRHELVQDVRWVRRHFVPWAVRRIRGVSSGDRVLPKHVALVDVLPAGTLGP